MEHAVGVALGIHAGGKTVVLQAGHHGGMDILTVQPRFQHFQGGCLGVQHGLVNLVVPGAGLALQHRARQVSPIAVGVLGEAIDNEKFMCLQRPMAPRVRHGTLRAAGHHGAMMEFLCSVTCQIAVHFALNNHRRQHRALPQQHVVGLADFRFGQKAESQLERLFIQLLRGPQLLDFFGIFQGAAFKKQCARGYAQRQVGLLQFAEQSGWKMGGDLNRLRQVFFLCYQVAQHGLQREWLAVQRGADVAESMDFVDLGVFAHQADFQLAHHDMRHTLGRAVPQRGVGDRRAGGIAPVRAVFVKQLSGFHAQHAK